MNLRPPHPLLDAMMPLQPSWDDIAVRLLLTMIAGAIIGINRGTRGHAAGLRTTILVGLAASVAMIQANILLLQSGKTPQSFSVLDLMRLPLGILTGVGFIGAGVIIKRGELITGVTTASTLWMMSVLGLCFGGGQLALGCVGTALAIATLWGLRRLEERIPRERRAILVVISGTEPSAAATLERLLREQGYGTRFCRKDLSGSNETRLCYEISWRQKDTGSPPTRIMEGLSPDFRIERFEIVVEPT